MKSQGIWEFPMVWLVHTVVTWPKMRLWQISTLFETFGSDGSLQDTLKVSNRHYLKLSDSLFETFLIRTCNSFGFGFEKFQKFQITYLISSLIWKFQISNKWDLKQDVQFQLCIKPTGFLVKTRSLLPIAVEIIDLNDVEISVEKLWSLCILNSLAKVLATALESTNGFLGN